MNMRRIAILGRQAIATVILLAMLIAPLCAPLCGSRACADSQTTTGDCHNSVTANADTQQTGVGTAGVCSLGELPTAALNEAKTSADQLKQVFPLHVAPQLPLVPQATLIAVNSATTHVHNEPRKNSLIESTILRI